MLEHGGGRFHSTRARFWGILIERGLQSDHLLVGRLVRYVHRIQQRYVRLLDPPRFVLDLLDDWPRRAVPIDQPQCSELKALCCAGQRASDCVVVRPLAKYACERAPAALAEHCGVRPMATAKLRVKKLTGGGSGHGPRLEMAEVDLKSSKPTSVEAPRCSVSWDELAKATRTALDQHVYGCRQGGRRLLRPQLRLLVQWRRRMHDHSD